MPRRNMHVVLIVFLYGIVVHIYLEEKSGSPLCTVKVYPFLFMASALYIYIHREDTIVTAAPRKGKSWAASTVSWREFPLPAHTRSHVRAGGRI